MGSNTASDARFFLNVMEFSAINATNTNYGVAGRDFFSSEMWGENKKNNESPTRRIFVIIKSSFIFVEGYGVFQALEMFYALIWGNLHTQNIT